MLTLSLNCGAQSLSIKDSILPITFTPRAIQFKSDTLICLDKRQAHMASLQLKKIPIYKSIIKDQDTVILKQKQNIQLKDSIILTKEKYIDSLYYNYNNYRLETIKNKEEKKYFKKESMYKNIGLIILFTLFLIK